MGGFFRSACQPTWSGSTFLPKRRILTIHIQELQITQRILQASFAMKEIVIIQQNYQKASREARNITSAFSVLVFFSDVPFTDIITPSLPYFTHFPLPRILMQRAAYK
jgi:hypothetical protein